MNLSALIKELQSGLDEYGEMEVICFSYPDHTREITEVFRSGDGEVCITSTS